MSKPQYRLNSEGVDFDQESQGEGEGKNELGVLVEPEPLGEIEEMLVKMQLKKQQRQEMLLASFDSKKYSPLNKQASMLKTSMRFVPGRNNSPNVTGNPWDPPYLFKIPGSEVKFDEFSSKSTKHLSRTTSIGAIQAKQDLIDFPYPEGGSLIEKAAHKNMLSAFKNYSNSENRVETGKLIRKEHKPSFRKCCKPRKQAVNKLDISKEESEKVMKSIKPEVTTVQFLEKLRVGQPIVPIKFETTNNFSFQNSKYYWEAASKGTSNPNLWTLLSESLVFTPSLQEVGTFLRLTIVPSDQNQRFGPPLSVEIPGVIENQTLESGPKLMYQERLTRMKPKTRDTIRVISYNILSEDLCKPDWFNKSPKESLALAIEYRLPLLNAELEAYDGDIYCFQEMDQKHFEANFTIFLRHSILGLQGLFSCKSGNSTEGVATFYNPNKFRLVDSHPTVDIREYMVNLTFYSDLKQRGGLESLFATLEERGNVLQLVLLEYSNDQQKLLLIGNTHLYWKPDGEHVRLLQTMTCVRYMEKLIQSYEKQFPDKSITTIFCGDFNSRPAYSSFRFLSSGLVYENDSDWTSHNTEKIIPGLKFTHNLNLFTAFPNQELTNITSKFSGCLDYIWYQKDKLELQASYPPPSKGTSGYLPNFSAPSDHLPLIADFCFKRK